MHATAPAPRPWLFSPALDLLVGCGAWSLPLLAGTYFLQQDNGAAVAFAFYLLAVFCNNPHYMATIHRAYHTAEDFKKYRFFTVYVTVLLGLTVLLVHFVPGLFPWVLTLYLTWSPWHYTGQNFGIAQMLARRAGVLPDPAARHLLYASYVASYAVWFLTLHTTREGDPYFLSLGIPVEPAFALQIVGILAFFGCAGAAFVRLRRHVPAGALVGPMVLTLTQALWFVAPTLLASTGLVELPASYFSAGALAFMHCAQYLWITSYYARRETGDVPTTATKPKPPFSFARYYLVLVIGGIALFVPGPWLTSRMLGHDFVESFLIFMALVNLHHFILDGAIWKLRDGRIARLLLGRQAPAPDELDAEPPAFGHHLGWLFGATSPARFTRYALGAGILGVGAIDQLQYLQTQRGARPEALTIAERLNPSDTRVHFRRAQLAMQAGDTATARTELERVLTINPRNAPAQHLMGELIFRSGDAAAALAHYDRMAQLFRPDVSVAVNRGLLASEAGLNFAAAERFAEALQLAPHRKELHLLLAQALVAAGDTTSAIRQYDLFCTLFEEDPGDFELMPRYLSAGLALGELQTAAGDTLAAEKRLQSTADVAATHRYFAETALALDLIAELQEASNRSELAAKNRALAAQARSFVGRR